MYRVGLILFNQVPISVVIVHNTRTHFKREIDTSSKRDR